MNTKFKNLNYLNMFTSIEIEFKTAIDMLEANNASECFFHLKMCILGLESLLIKDTEWFKSNKKVGYKPTYDEILKRLEKEKILNSKQVDLFTTINNLAGSYDYYDKNKLKKRQRIETLNILCTRLDNEIPSIMAHLGVGGASRLDYLNNLDKDCNAVKIDSKEDSPKKKEKQTGKTKTPKISLYLRLKYLLSKITKCFDNPLGFFIKFIVVAAIFVFLVIILFVNKDYSQEAKDWIDYVVPIERDYIKDTISNIPDAIGSLLLGIGDFIISFFEFLKFE